MELPRDARERVRLLERAIASSGIGPGEAHPCPYLPDRQARNLTIIPSPLVPGVYATLMDLNFRRMGAVFYRPACGSCRECRAIRIRVPEFRPTRGQRRCSKRNADLSVSLADPVASPEKLELYRRYLASRHDGQMSGSREELEGFLYNSPVASIEIEYRLLDRLIAVGIADVEPQAMSAVYCYFDPEQAARSLGVFNVLWMLAECRRRQLRHLYLGLYVEGCSKMSYKRSFRPCEALGSDGEWSVLSPRLGATSPS
jgi:arginine-tRNA-protein transferase